MSGIVALNSAEERELKDCEATISRNLNSFRETGEALMQIRDSRLYRAEFKTFEEYCQKRWTFTRMRAHQFIESAKVLQNVNNCLQKPQTESQARPLAKLPKEQQAEAWKEAVETAPKGKVTAKHVEEIVIRKRRRIVLKKTKQEELPPEPEVKASELIDEFTCSMNEWAGRLKPVKLTPELVKRAKAAVEAVVRELL